jgi:hypothetical protein
VKSRRLDQDADRDALVDILHLCSSVGSGIRSVSALSPPLRGGLSPSGHGRGNEPIYRQFVQRIDGPDLGPADLVASSMESLQEYAGSATPARPALDAHFR